MRAGACRCYFTGKLVPIIPLIFPRFPSSSSNLHLQIHFSILCENAHKYSFHISLFIDNIQGIPVLIYCKLRNAIVSEITVEQYINCSFKTNSLQTNLLLLNKNCFVSLEMTHTTFCIRDITLNQELAFVAQNIYSQTDPGVDEDNRKQQLKDYLTSVGWRASFVGKKEGCLEVLDLEIGYSLGTDYQPQIRTHFVVISIQTFVTGL